MSICAPDRDFEDFLSEIDSKKFPEFWSFQMVYSGPERVRVLLSFIQYFEHGSNRFYILYRIYCIS